MIITITGNAGSGKSSVAKLLAKKLSYRHYSAGDAQREIALEKGITIAELGEIEAKDDAIDRMIDEKMGEICRREKDAVVDAWLGAYFAPHAVKIFLEADIDTRVRRRLGQKRDEENFDDYEEAKRTMARREETNRKRWIDYYGFDYADTGNYDIVIRTDGLDVDAVVDEIIRKSGAKPA